MHPDTIHTGDCHDVLKTFPDDSIHLTVTSPPYDALRTYKGNPPIDIAGIATELYRVTVDGGFACVVIQDQTKDFAKSLTSFRLALAFADAGWKLFETCIYARPGRPGKWWNTRWRVDHEYIFQFFKGNRPRTFDKEPLKIPSKNAGQEFGKLNVRHKNGECKPSGQVSGVVPAMKCRGTIWHYGASCVEGNRVKLQHPATFPDKLASDLIVAFSKPEDVVLDPFLGSGTTAVMAKALNRRYVGIELAPEYVDIAKARLA